MQPPPETGNWQAATGGGEAVSPRWDSAPYISTHFETLIKQTQTQTQTNTHTITQTRREKG